MFSGFLPYLRVTLRLACVIIRFRFWVLRCKVWVWGFGFRGVDNNESSTGAL